MAGAVVLSAVLWPSLSSQSTVRAQGRPGAPAPAAGVMKGPMVEGIQSYTLPNGLLVLLVPDASKPTVTVNLTIFAGSKHEGMGETGMAHLLEHMVFKGSPRHPNIPKELNDRGAQWNGTTWYDRTNYYETVKSTPENLAWAIDLEADRFVNSFIKGEDLKSEFTVVRNEFESGENSPFRMLMQRTFATAYEWHNYGKSTIGNKTDIEGVPVERLRAFYRKYYQPDNGMVVVAGKFDESTALRLVTEKFGRIPKPVRTLEKGNLLFSSYTQEPTQDGERAVALRRTGDVQMAMATYHIPAGTHPDYAALDVAGELLGAEVSGRLYKALVEPKLVTSVGTWVFQLREPALFMAFAELRKEQSLDSAQAVFLRTLEAFASAAPSDAEVMQAKTKLLKTIDMSLNNSDEVGVALSDWASMGDWRFLFIHRDRIKGVSAADVQRVAKQYLMASNRTLGTFHPTPTPVRAEVPPAPDFKRLVAEYRGTETKEAGEAWDPTPSAIDARVKKLALPGGMRVQFLARKTRGAVVHAQVQLRYGTEQTLSGMPGVPQATAAMLERGTATRTRQQIKEEFDRLKARVSAFGGTEGVSVRIETTRENFVPVLQLVGDMLRKPSFPADEFEKFKQEALAGLEQQRSDPQALAQTAAMRAVSPYPKGHPNYAATIDEQIADTKAMTLAQVQSFFARFYGAQAGDVAIAGDFDAEAARTTLTQLFGGWTSSEPFRRVVARAGALDSTSITIETPDKQMAMFIAAQPVTMRSMDPDWPAMRVANFIFGESPLSDRVGTRLRQKEGLSYGAGTQMDTDMRDSAGIHMAYAIYNPANADRLLAAYKEELRRALTDGFTEEEVSKAKTSFLEQRFQARSENGTLPGMMILRAENGLSFEQWDGGIERTVAKLTAADVSGAFKKHVRADKVAWVLAGDFEGAKKKAAAPKP
jgi:zinc protease